MAEDHRFSQIAEVARRFKVDAVRDAAADEDADISNIVIAMRQGEPLFYIHPEINNRDALRECLYWAAAMTLCDEIFCVADAYMRFMGDDEEEVVQGQLIQEWQEGRGDITECLLIHRYPMVGEAMFAQYTYERKGKKLTWTHISTWNEGKMDGALIDHIRGGFAQAREFNTKLRKQLDEGAAAAELTREQQHYHETRAIGRFLSTRDGVGMVQVRTEPRAAFVKGEQDDAWV